MFTGIVEELGTIEHVEDQGDAVRVTIRAQTVLDDVRPGDSIAVHIEAWVIRRNEADRFLVTEGRFTYVALDQQGRPREIAR